LSSGGVLSGTPAAGTGGIYSITITANNGINPNATQTFTLTVNQSPAITSANSTTFTAGTTGTFTVTGTGYPAPTFSENGTLPSGVTFSSAGVLSGTPAAGTGGSYPITITASNRVGTNAAQNFTLTVGQAPAITSANSTTFAANQAGTFTVTTTAFPTAALSESGALPSGVTFTDNGNGTATLAGTPGASTAGSYPFTLTAGNGVGTNATQSFTLTVNPPPSYVVTTATDDASGVAANCPSGGGGLTCSLRDALAAASAANGGTISFDPTVFAAGNTAAQNTITLASTLNIPSNTTITGSAAGITIAGGGPTSSYIAFNVADGITGAAINGLTITNAYNTGGTGAAFYVSGALTVTNSTISGNAAQSSSGGVGLPGLSYGGGFYVYSTGSLTLIDSTIAGNSAGSYGGGIFNQGSVSVIGSTIANNTAGTGGGIHNDGGTVSLANSILSGNSGGDFSGGPTYSNNGGNEISVSGISLAPLGNYGGPTQTMIPLPGSAAICAINPSTATGADQRGEPRTTTYGAITCQDSGAVQTNYALSFSTDPPANVFTGTSFGAAVTLDESGSPFVATATPLPTITIPLTLNGSGTLTGGSAAVNDATGIAAYSGLQLSQTGSGDTLTATLTLNPNITPTALSISTISSTFDVGVPVPTVTAISPNIGPATGGTVVIITGTNFTGATAVDFGSISAADKAVLSNSTITAISPPGIGVVDVTVTTLGGTSATTPADQFTYTVPPALTAAFLPSTINIGASTSLAFTITNPNALALTGVGFVDTLPAGLAIATPSSLTNSCGGTATATAGGSSIVLSGASVPANGSCTLSANVTAITSGPKFNTTGVVISSQSLPAPGATAVLTVSAMTLSPSAGPLAGGTVAVAYSQQFTAGNGASPYTYTVSAGSIPAGLSLNSATGLLTGAPTAGGPFSFSVQAEDNNSNTVTQAYTLAIAAPTIVLSPNSLPAGTYGTAYSQTITANGGIVPYTYQISAGSLPAGISFATNGTLSGTPSATGTFSFTVEATDSSTVPGHYSGSLGFVLSIGKAATTTTLGVSSVSITPGQNETLTAQVASTTTGTPTGTVSFYDGTSLLSTVPLSGGAASYSTTTLAPGVTHIITATYSGDMNFTTSSTASSASVTVAPLDFTMTINGPSSATVVPGRTITYQVTVTPDYGSYAGTVNFAVSGLPPGATATFSPSSIAANGGAQTVTVTIQTASATALNRAPPAPSPGRRGAPISLALLALFGLGGLRRRGRALKRFLCIVALLTGGAAATLSLSGCGSGNGFFDQAPQNYTITITATAGSLQHSANVMLNVQ
jgi:CSLREA domain-containing protein